MLAWYAAITQSFSELIAETHLMDQGFSPFLPRIRERRIVRGREVTTAKPYIPGYIFVRFDRDLDGWGRINSTRGVKALMCNSPELPTRIRDGAMDVILDRCEGSYVRVEEVDLALSKFLPVGAAVIATEGAFAGHRGVVELTRAQRVDVLFNLFGRETRVTMSRAQVELVG